MKKTVYAIYMIALAGMLAGCNKDNSVAEKTPLTICASISNSVDEDTKTTFNTTNYQVTWTDGDKIKIFAPLKSASFRPFSTFNINEITDGGKKATFTDASGNEWENAGDAVAFYGKAYVEGKGGLSARTGGSSAYFPTFTYPESQNYTDGNPDTGLLLMTSNKVNINGTDYTPFQNLTFSHRSAIVKIPVKNTNGSSVTLKSIQISASAASCALRGEMYGYVVNKASFDNMESSWRWVVDQDTNAANKTVTLNNINVALTSSAQDYYIVIAPAKDGSTQGAITVTLTDSGENSKAFTFSTSLTAVAGKVYSFPVIDWGSK